MLYSQIKRLYRKLPISPGLRYQIGQYKRKLLRQTVSAHKEFQFSDVIAKESIDSSNVPRISVGQFEARDFFFFGVIDWHFRHQRPQQLALAIAQTGRRVFYVSVNFIDSKTSGFQLERIHKDLPLYQVFFHLPGIQSIYTAPPSEADLQQLREGLLELFECAGTRSAVHIVQHPYWYRLAGFVPFARLIYDCMDFHAGFSNTGQAHENIEQKLITTADLTVVTSDFLVQHATELGAKKIALIRNGAEFEHFYPVAYDKRAISAEKKKPVIGYYGAIAEWFDADLLKAISRQFPHCQIRLIGDDSANVRESLNHCANIEFFGEKPYVELPDFLADFDVCLIPFKVNALTLATNPVKVYEYLSAGKPVVGTNLPELSQFGDLVYRANDTETFLAMLRRALEEHVQDRGGVLKQRRIEFARQQTWQQRAQELLRFAEHTRSEPSVSVVLVSYKQWQLTQRCLESLVNHSDQQDIEIIVVDNASDDETPAGLKSWAAQDSKNRRIVLNALNIGFGPAVNQGLALARGDYLVILNNDIVVSPGWIRGMRRHLEVDQKLGLLCPVTNNIGNEARLEVQGNSVQDVMAFARRYNLKHTGKLLPLSVAAFFCVMMPRRVYQTIGGLDEQFVPGFFEDDDYCLRIKQCGWHIGCAEDVFVYHELSASFDQIANDKRQLIFQRNKTLFEKKWGKWTPHVYRGESAHHS